MRMISQELKGGSIPSPIYQLHLMGKWFLWRQSAFFVLSLRNFVHEFILSSHVDTYQSILSDSCPFWTLKNLFYDFFSHCGEILATVSLWNLLILNQSSWWYVGIKWGQGWIQLLLHLSNVSDCSDFHVLYMWLILYSCFSHFSVVMAVCASRVPDMSWKWRWISNTSFPFSSYLVSFCCSIWYFVVILQG